MGRGGKTLLGVAVYALCAVGPLAAAPPSSAPHQARGSDRPPASVPAEHGRQGLTPDGKNIWMTEWSACWHVTMGHLSKVLHIPIRAGLTPQQAAHKLATRAVFLLYETTPETLAAKDGCLNGILWRYYHPAKRPN
jgi:hypothetical protein